MLMVSEPDKLILESLAKAKGISINEVKEDLKKNKKTKPKKRKKKSAEPTIQLISSGRAKSIEFSQIKSRITQTEAKEDVFKWRIKDVALYVRSQYQERYNEDWKHKTIGASTELMRVHDRILDLYGHCDYLVMRDYVDYIFEEEIDKMIDRAKGVFYISNFRDDIYVKAFSEQYDYEDSFERAMKGETKKKKSSSQAEIVEDFSTSNESIEEIFFLSEDSFVKTYGIVVCIFWLIKCQQYTNKKAAKKVLDICKRLNIEGEFKIVKERTEFLSPYHESITFPRMEEFLKNIDGRYKIDIEYKENDIIKSKFKFLEEKV